jgi:hypothetical protein
MALVMAMAVPIPMLAKCLYFQNEKADCYE